MTGRVRSRRQEFHLAWEQVLERSGVRTPGDWTRLGGERAAARRPAPVPASTVLSWRSDPGRVPRSWPTLERALRTAALAWPTVLTRAELDTWHERWRAADAERRAEAAVPAARPAAGGPGGAAGPAGPAGAAAYRQLCRWARRFRDDLDVVDSERTRPGAAVPPAQLSGGLYVRRALQDRVLQALDAAPSAAVLVTGEAGHGKSSLLWGLAGDLDAQPRAEPFLVNGAWLLHPGGGQAGGPGGGPGGPLLDQETIVAGAAHALSLARAPVVLLDTADLLLHDDRHEMALLDLCEDLDAAGVRLVVTCRPEEAQRLRRGFARMALGPYDDAEIPAAIRGHADHYCPDAAPRDDAVRVRRLMEPVARGLPVREVCRSPLHLRLLFELARDDGAFPSAEIDVTGLYRRYWDHRVVTDRRLHGRQDAGGARDADAAGDLSEVTGAAAVALMSAGRTELGREELLDRIAALGGAGAGAGVGPAAGAAAAGLDRLVARGVLAGGASGGLRFFHQTMFEYAAARGLLRGAGRGAVDLLHRWVEEHPRDFFVGAILEQLLMLCAALGRHRAAVRTALERMAALPDAVVLHGIAVAVAAQHPAVGVPVGGLLRTAPHAIARRYAVLAPTVGNADVGALLPRLRGLWERREASIQSAVLEALERLAAQNPFAVHAALAEWQCVREITERRAPGAGVEVLPRLLVLTAPADPAAARSGLLTVLAFALADNLSELACAVLTRWARQWELLGSAATAADVAARVARAQRASGLRDAEPVRTALGRVLAASWRADLGLPGEGPGAAPGWPGHLAAVVAALEADDQDTRANAGLIAVALVLAELPPGHWAIEATLDTCLTMTGPAAPFTLQRGAFPLLLRADCPAADALVRRLGRLTRGLPAAQNRPAEAPERWAAVARNVLAQPSVPPARVRQALEHAGRRIDPALWLRPDGLAAVLLPAAAGGLPAARRAVARAASAPPDARGFIRRSLHRALTYGLPGGLPGAGAWAGTLVDLALADADTVLLEALVTGRAKKHADALPPPVHRQVLAELTARAAALLAMISAELDRDSGTVFRRALTLWDRLVEARVLDPPDVAALTGRYARLSDQKSRAALLGLLGTTAVRAPARYPAARAFLAALIVAPDGALVPLRGGAEGTRSAARAALLRAACESGPPDGATEDLALALACAPPTDAWLLSRLGQLVRRVAADRGAERATDLLLRVIDRATALDLGRAAHNHLANVLRGAMDSVLARHAPAAEARLWERLRTRSLPDKYAMLLVSSAVRKSFDATRPALEALLTDPAVAPAVRQRINDELAARSRERAAHDLTWLLSAAAAASAAPATGHH
ncbi:ATP-binding protein [Streptomyces sp. MP131-18]|uniref:NACHT domain-containing protein n=1 Tax=Streptomyces sp. MP131-18 TaxID=1857892 RepID=UPI0009D12725|nr:ATP-binding protein [Streptomyces sp. MP131-18]ONK13328.1 hypothetical protein STBA_40940 [Streptomyces sp. MP131-18]